MATSFVEATVTGPKGSAAVEFLIDSGATYSVLPMTTWQTLGLVPKRSIRLRLADGTAIERHVSECHFALEDADGTSPVVLGDVNDAAPARRGDAGTGVQPVHQVAPPDANADGVALVQPEERVAPAIACKGHFVCRDR